MIIFWTLDEIAAILYYIKTVLNHERQEIKWQET
jgi:hypothetical protein